MSSEVNILLKLVGPVMITTFFEFLPGFLSIVLAGNMDSPYTPQYLLTLVSTAIGLGLTSALDTLCSQAYGAKRPEKIGEYVQTGVVVLSANLILVFATSWHAEVLLTWLGQDAEVASLSASFSRWMLPGIPFHYAYELTRKALQAQHILTPLVIIAVVGNAVNIGVGYLLAYHTSVGFNGIAMGRSVGNMVLPLCLIPYFVWRPHHLRQWWASPWNLKVALGHLQVFMRLGVPGMLMNAMEMWGLETLSILSGLLPDSVVSVAAHSVLVNVNLLVYTTFAGLSVAANIRVGNCLGAGLPKTARLARTAALRITFGVATVFALFLYGFNGAIPRLFLNAGKSADLASKVMALWSPLTVVDGLNCVSQGIFRGAGEQKSGAITNALAYYGVGIPAGVYLAFQCELGVEGLWFGTGIGDTLAVITLTLLMKYCWNWEKLADRAKDSVNL
ncbi:Multidrug/Oligosaccharidyl-lipid/polysaccharide (MOP) Flippase Superfamily [Phytophthora cinnamomi]|uniref:Multidrug/Oligosaccharidyl-lipid/polysaccharide (MOP) Flippase Superfamily n=1 Tax=Phytophthora cinnamomi TaxID=4785 RepID=UPI0035596AA4|nr:Multidrug/Oligosaccharidyl-lipid/polysaccharide (MOP) Flippase Superfamily [Phytophthora cinnamomi]